MRSDTELSDEPAADCSLCPKLCQLRVSNRQRFPDWHNAPVPSFGNADAQLLVVGLAPGLRGANRTGRPFTGDYAGEVLYPALSKFDLARGRYGAEKDDDFSLVGCRVTNAVRCVPPENRPTGREVTTCNRFLAQEILRLAALKVILALGTIAHAAVLDAMGVSKSTARFGHGLVHHVNNGIVVVDSYHCSRLNINTGRLTREMFETVMKNVVYVLRG